MKKPTHKKILVLDCRTSTFCTTGESPGVLRVCVLCLPHCWWAHQIVQSYDRSCLGRFCPGSDRKQCHRRQIERVSTEIKRSKAELQPGAGGQWGNQVWRSAPVGTSGVPVGVISLHTGGFWRFCLGKTQASCAFQVVAAGGKCMLGKSSDKTLLSLKNGGDAGLLASRRRRQMRLQDFWCSGMSGEK